MSWTLLSLRDLSTAIHRQPRSWDLRISLGWKDSETPDSIARHLEAFQQLSRYLLWTRGWWQSVTGGKTPAPLPLCHHGAQRVWPAPRPVNPSAHAVGLRVPPSATTNACSGTAAITLLSLCLMPKPVRSPSSTVNLCRCPSWKLVLSSKGLVPSHSGSLLPPALCRISQVIPLKDAVLKNPGWVWLLWEKDKSFLCCCCWFAVVFLHSHSLPVFIKKGPLYY